MLEAWGALATGWVRRTMVEPEATFTFIGFEWLQIFNGPTMYVWYAMMGLAGLMVMLGWRYKLNMGIYTILWTGTYLMQKSSYNNHYYLLILICIVMWLLPAHRYFSLDVLRKPKLERIAMPRWVYVLVIGQLWIVYTYASIAKFYPDWLDGTVATNLMARKKHYPIVGELLQYDFAHWSIVWFGLLFDLLIVPALLYKRTRVLALIVSVFFHLFNSIVFQIGIFPYLSLAFILFFFSAQTVHRRSLWWKPFYQADEIRVPTNWIRPVVTYGIPIYLLIQVLLPIRHHVIPGDVLWTEEGHRMSWRMMLRSRTGRTTYYIQEKGTNLRQTVNLSDYVTSKQIRGAKSKPDIIWAMAQRLKAKEAEAGRDVQVFVRSMVSINGQQFRTLIDPGVDLASVPWNHLEHHDWLLDWEPRAGKGVWWLPWDKPAHRPGTGPLSDTTPQ